jgi:hypothetical protein
MENLTGKYRRNGKINRLKMLVKSLEIGKFMVTTTLSKYLLNDGFNVLYYIRDAGGNLQGFRCTWLFIFHASGFFISTLQTTTK